MASVADAPPVVSRSTTTKVVAAQRLVQRVQAELFAVHQLSRRATLASGSDEIRRAGAGQSAITGDRRIGVGCDRRRAASAAGRGAPAAGEHRSRADEPHARSAELPSSVRRFARFAPAKRLRLGASEIAAALAVEPGFRDAVAEVVGQSSPELVGQVSAGNPPATADPVDVAVIAYLLRPPGWSDLLADIAERLAGEGRQRDLDAELDRLRAEIWPAHRAATRRWPAIATRPRSAAEAAVAEQAEQSGRAASPASHRCRRSCRRPGETAEQLAARAGPAARRAGPQHRWRGGRAAPGAGPDRRAGEPARRPTGVAQRAAREHDEARLWVLLETITAAAAGLRRELDLDRARQPAGRLGGRRRCRPAERWPAVHGGRLAAAAVARRRRTCT